MSRQALDYTVPWRRGDTATYIHVRTPCDGALLVPYLRYLLTDTSSGYLKEPARSRNGLQIFVFRQRRVRLQPLPDSGLQPGRPLGRRPRRVRIQQHQRALEVPPPAHHIPHDADEGEAGEHHARVVHARRRHGDGGRHAEEDDGQRDPHEAGGVDDGAEPAAEGEGRGAHGAAPAQQRHQDRDAVRDRQADRRHAREGVEGRRRAEVDAAQHAVDAGGEREPAERDAEAGRDALPDVGEGDGAVAGEGIRAAAGGREGADAGEEEDAEDQEEDWEGISAGLTGGGGGGAWDLRLVWRGRVRETVSRELEFGMWRAGRGVVRYVRAKPPPAEPVAILKMRPMGWPLATPRSNLTSGRTKRMGMR